MKKLIIGKNSSIISNLMVDLNENQFDLISHAEIDQVDLSKYSKVFLFSWSKNSLLDNTKLIKKIPADKLIFVSSVATYALHVRKQWSSYPNWKYRCEKLVSEYGGKIVRLGILRSNVIEKINGWYFHTDLKHLLDYLNCDTHCDITNLFEVRYQSPSQKRYIVEILEYLYRRHHTLTGGVAVIDKLFSLVLRYFGIVSYSYTYDCNLMACDTLQIGYGALGSQVKPSEQKTICVSGQQDETLTRDGFTGTRLGFEKIGLSKYWHGAYIYTIHNKLYKGVLFPVKRPRPPRSALIGHVDQITWSDESKSFCIKIASHIDQLEFPCKKLIVAAGILETGRLILTLFPSKKEILYDDHDIGYIGSVNTKELIQKNIINKKGPFIYGRRVVKLFQDKCNECLLDFRPLVKGKLASDPSFYNKPAISIIIAIMKKISISRINEAVFNRFGFAFYTKKSTVFMQALNKECISLTSQQVCRKQKTDTKVSITTAIKKEFTSFSPLENWTIVDGQHIYPSNAEEILQALEIQPFASQLQLVGYYRSYRLSSNHHTVDLQHLTRVELN